MAGDSPRSFAGERGRCASTFWRGGGGLSGTRIGPRCVSGRLGATSGLTIGGGHRRGHQSGRGRQQGTMAPICKTSSGRQQGTSRSVLLETAGAKADASFPPAISEPSKQVCLSESNGITKQFSFKNQTWSTSSWLYTDWPSPPEAGSFVRSAKRLPVCIVRGTLPSMYITEAGLPS